MRLPINERAEQHLPERESILLTFDERDLAIVRRWSKIVDSDDQPHDRH